MVYTLRYIILPFIRGGTIINNLNINTLCNEKSLQDLTDNIKERTNVQQGNSAVMMRSGELK